MLHEKIREERKRRRLSHTELAQAAGVSRSQLIALEQGGNPTLSTIEKTLAQLGLRLDVVPEDSERDATLHAALEMQRHALALHEAAGKLVTALGGTPAEETGVLPGRGGARRHTDEFSPAVIEKLGQVADLIDRERRGTRK